MKSLPYGKDAETARTTINDVGSYNLNYQKLFLEQMLKITRFYYYQTNRDELVFAASNVFENW